MKQVYIANPLHGDYHTNIRNAIEYCRMAAERGVLALAPHIIFSQWCNDTIPEQREQGLKLGLELLAHSEELWIMGNQISKGMYGEIEFATEHNIPTFYVQHPTFPQYYPISPDGNCLLSKNDCIPNSYKENYEEQWIILCHDFLAVEHRTPLNQLWICSHGPGCSPDYHFSDTIHVVHPVDRDSMAIARDKVWGVAKPEILRQLTALYPKLGETLMVMQLEKPDEDMSR